MRPETEHIRLLIHAVYGVDILHHRRKTLNVEARQLALMALHDELDMIVLHAEVELGMVSAFPHSRRSLTKKIDEDEGTRTRVATFYKLLDENPLRVPA